MRALLSVRMLLGRRSLLVLAAAFTGLLMTAMSVPHASTRPQAVEAARMPVFADTATTAGSVVVEGRSTHFGSEVVEVVYVSALGGDESSAAVPPGIDRLPAQNEMFVSPALANLLAEHRDRDMDPLLLLDRFDSSIVGTIGRSGLTTPSELRAYVGASLPTGAAISSWGAASGPLARDGGERLTLTVVAVGIVLPLSMLALSLFRGARSHFRRAGSVANLVGSNRGHLARFLAPGLVAFAVLSVLGGIAVNWLIARRERALGLHWWEEDLAASLSSVLVTGLVFVAILGLSFVGASGPESDTHATSYGQQVPRFAVLGAVTLLVASMVSVVAARSVVTSESMAAAVATLHVATIASVLWIAFRLLRPETLLRSGGRRLLPLVGLGRSRPALRGALVALSIGAYLGAVALALVQDYDRQIETDRAVAEATWPEGTALMLGSRGPTTVDWLERTPSVNGILELSVLQGPLVSDGTFVTVLIAPCDQLGHYVRLEVEFPECHNKGAIALNRGESLLSESDRFTVDRLQRGAPYEVGYVVRDELQITQVSTPFDSVETSEPLSTLFESTGAHVLVGNTTISNEASAAALSPLTYFVASDTDTIERFRTHISQTSARANPVREIADIAEGLTSRARAFRSSLYLSAASVVGVVVLLYRTSLKRELKQRRHTFSLLDLLGEAPEYARSNDLTVHTIGATLTVLSALPFALGFAYIVRQVSGVNATLATGPVFAFCALMVFATAVVTFTTTLFEQNCAQ